MIFSGNFFETWNNAQAKDERSKNQGQTLWKGKLCQKLVQSHSSPHLLPFVRSGKCFPPGKYKTS